MRVSYKRYIKGDPALKWGWVNKSDFDAAYPRQQPVPELKNDPAKQ